MLLFAFFFFSSRRRHTRGALVTGVQTCALPICSVQVLQHQPRGRLGGTDHAWNARSRMRARADEVEVADAVIAVIRAEPRRLPQQRFEAERRTQMRVQLAMEIGGREDVERHHIAPEARSDEHTSELQSLMRNSSAVFCITKKPCESINLPTS